MTYNKAAMNVLLSLSFTANSQAIKGHKLTKAVTCDYAAALS